MAEPCVQRASYVWHPLQDQDGGLSSVSIMLFASLKDKISFLASDSLTLIAQISIRKTSRPAGCHEEVIEFHRPRKSTYPWNITIFSSLNHLEIDHGRLGLRTPGTWKLFNAGQAGKMMLGPPCFRGILWYPHCQRNPHGDFLKYGHPKSQTLGFLQFPSKNNPVWMIFGDPIFFFRNLHMNPLKKHRFRCVEISSDSAPP